VMIGSVASVDVVWLFSDVMNGLMTFPNLIGLLGLSGVVVYETKQIQNKIKEEKAEKRKTA
ncbi:alanine:cation symporter family protein, partial [Jeotgalibacillus sp. ET6]|uniref:alanine:cation symporter family protein n=1 Tax=Jeotgalibacillus sp. ET6 TaxID=3037260 RepID=UPI0024187980